MLMYFQEIILRIAALQEVWAQARLPHSIQGPYTARWVGAATFNNPATFLQRRASAPAWKNVRDISRTLPPPDRGRYRGQPEPARSSFTS